MIKPATTTTDADLRASLLEIGDAPLTAGPAVAAAPERVEPERLLSTWTTQVTSDACAALVATEQRLLADSGLAGGELFYAEGTAFAAEGWATIAGQDAEHLARPLAADLATAHGATIAAEGRRDRAISLPEWRIDVDGRLAHQARPDRATLTASAWARLVGDAPDGAHAANANSWLGRATPRSRVARVRHAPEGDGAREIYALVSERYAVLDSDEIAHVLAQRLPTCRGVVEYDRATTRTRIRLVDQAPIDVPALSGVGRVHSLGIDLSTRDDGLGSIVAQAFLERRRCLNASLSSVGTGLVRRRHLGTRDDLLLALDEVLGQVPALIAELRTAWARAAAEYYLDSETGARLSVPEAVARLVAAGHLPTLGVSAEDAVDTYLASWRAEESPHTVAGVVMAAQRAAHEGSWRTRWADETAEEAAAGLLYQTVSWRLDAVDA